MVRRISSRSDAPPVALETTLLVHGVPRSSAMELHRELGAIVRAKGASPCLIGVIDGTPTVGMTDAELETLLAAPQVAKANTSNLGVLIARKAHAATTVSTTMELAAAAGIGFFATGGLGGVHKGFGTRWDVSADLWALTRYPLGVVASGVKSILDVTSTREMLETMGVPVVGFRADRFPAFYLRESEAGVDARFDDAQELAAFVRFETTRTGRAVLVVNAIPKEHEIKKSDWDTWLAQAEQRAAAQGASGRDATPAILAALHEISAGATLRANIELVKSNVALAATLARAAADQAGHAAN